MGLDLIIRNGLIVDGTGAPPIRADLGVAGGKVEIVGELPASCAAREQYDANGMTVCPGFIDIHAHSDYTILLNRRAESSIRQGVTTEVVGNCGMSAGPLGRPDDLPLQVIEYEPDPDLGSWTTFGQWRELVATGASINIAGLVGHGALRLAAMDQPTSTATSSEMRTMGRLLEQSMAEGAFGLSSGLEYFPGNCSAPDELVYLAQVVSKNNGYYASHIRNRDYSYLEALTEVLETARTANASVQISHIAPRWGCAETDAQSALGKVERSVRDGQDVWIDNHPYVTGRGVGFAAMPAWSMKDGMAGLGKLLSDPEGRAELHRLATPQWKHVSAGRWDLLTIFDAPNNREAEGYTLEALSSLWDDEPWNVLCRLVKDELPAPQRLLWSAPIHTQDDVDLALGFEHCLMMSDGSTVAPYGPYEHNRNIYSYGWVGRILRDYVRDRRVLSLPNAIHRMTGLVAERLGLPDRGTLRPGCHADIVVFDAAIVRDESTFQQPIAYTSGVSDVWVNGVHTISVAEHTGAMAGRVLEPR